MLLVARTKEDIEAAVKRADGDGHMTEDSFNERLGDLDKDALVRVTGDIRALFAKVPNAGAFAKQKWLASLRTFGAALLVEDDGISYDSEVKMEGLAPEDLPIAEGEKPAQVVRRAGEVGFGVRNPAQTLRFYAAALGLNPITARQYSTGKAKLNRQLGIDIDRDVIDQLTGDATGSVSLTGGFAFRAQVADPASAKATLAKVAKRLPKLAKRRSLKLSKPKGGDGFYGLSKPGGDQIAFGIVGENFVLATDPARAAQFAGQSASDVADTKGAIVLAADAGAIAKAIGAKQGQAPAAQILASSLGDLVGSVEAEPGKITSHYKLNVK
jgi:catechol 2,3-dioxygenase-like lactoylglutathione lyase family enzyme